MSLPKLSIATHELKIPSTGKTLKFRPFLVKEQKVLMLAQQSEDQNSIQNGIADVIQACTFDKIDPWKIPSFDLEYIFLNIRGKSVGEEVEISVLCPDDMETRVDVKIPLEEILVTTTEEHDPVIEVSDGIRIIMKYPTMKEISEISSDGVENVEQLFNMIKTCMWQIIDSSGEEEVIYQQADISAEDLEEFVGNLQTSQLETINKFFETMPKLNHTLEITNPKTEVKSEVVLEGFDDFFV